MGQPLWRRLDFEDVLVAIMTPKIQANRRRPKQNPVLGVDMLAKFFLRRESDLASAPVALITRGIIVLMKMLLAFFGGCICKIDLTGFRCYRW